MGRCTLRSSATTVGLATTAWMVLTAPAFAAGLYRCQAKDAVSLNDDDGAVSRNKTTEFLRKQNDNMIVDTATGAIRFGDDKPETWKIVQKGGPENDFVAVPRLNPADIATDFIRVRAWTELKTVVFIRFDLSTMITGTCEPIR